MGSVLNGRLHDRPGGGQASTIAPIGRSMPSSMARCGQRMPTISLIRIESRQAGSDSGIQIFRELPIS